MTKSHTLLLVALIALTANTIFMTERVMEYKHAAEHNAKTAFYLHECWNAETQTELNIAECKNSN